MQLREYQSAIVDKIKQSWKNGYKKPCLILTCGGGKSIICAEVAKRATQNKKHVLFCVHRLELCEQIRETFVSFGVDMDYCTIGMVQSLNKRLNTLQTPDLIIIDENHHVVANTYKKILDCFSKAHCLGVTATPCRINGCGLGEVNDNLIVGASAKWLIENGYLAPYKYFSIPVAQFSNVKTSRGDYDLKDLSELMEDSKIYGDTVANYRRLADGKKTIVYCTSVKSSQETAEEFRRSGYNAIFLDGKTKKVDRLQAMGSFRRGEVQILTNAMLFGEGLDVPDVECVILLRKTKSLGLFIQQSMRGMRIDPKNSSKISIIIDHVGNVFEHGMPDDDRVWTLDHKKRNKQNTVKVKTCPDCFAVIDQNTLECPYCQHDFKTAVRERQAKELIEAELLEVQLQHEKKIKNMKYSEFKTFAELVEFQKIKGYKFAFCLHKALELGIKIPRKYNNMLRYIKK